MTKNSIPCGQKCDTFTILSSLDTPVRGHAINLCSLVHWGMNLRNTTSPVRKTPITETNLRNEL
jgi:hypothetical protein